MLLEKLLVHHIGEWLKIVPNEGEIRELKRKIVFSWLIVCIVVCLKDGYFVFSYFYIIFKIRKIK